MTELFEIIKAVFSRQVTVCTLFIQWIGSRLEDMQQHWMNTLNVHQRTL